MNIMTYVRNVLVPNSLKVFLASIEPFKETIGKSLPAKWPKDWTCEENDVTLLQVVSDQGMLALNNLDRIKGMLPITKD